MRVLVATVAVPFHHGGAEAQAEGLRDALRRAGHFVDIVTVPFVTEGPTAILDAILAASLVSLDWVGGLSVDRVIALKFPAYFAKHRRTVVWLIHPPREVYDLWNSREYHGLAGQPGGVATRDAVIAADRRALTAVDKVFAISTNVCDRLRRFLGIDAEPLYPPPLNADQFHCADAEDFFFFPGRLVSHKRHELAIRAMARVPTARLVIAGRVLDPAYAARLVRLSADLGVADRVQVLGDIPEDEKLDLYGRCLAVLFPPFDEEYGLIAPEAMLSSKPLVTCSDSGGPLELLIDGVTGLIAEPAPESVGCALARLRGGRAVAAEMGRNARAHFQSLDITWDRVVQTLIG